MYVHLIHQAQHSIVVPKNFGFTEKDECWPREVDNTPEGCSNAPAPVLSICLSVSICRSKESPEMNSLKVSLIRKTTHRHPYRCVEMERTSWRPPCCLCLTDKQFLIMLLHSSTGLYFSLRLCTLPTLFVCLATVSMIPSLYALCCVEAR